MAKYGKYTDAKMRSKEELAQMEDYEEIMAAVASMQNRSPLRFVLILAGALVVIFIVVIAMILFLHYGSEWLLG